MSAVITPTKDAVPVKLAVVVPLYALLTPEMPVIVKGFAVISADKLGWVNE